MYIDSKNQHTKVTTKRVELIEAKGNLQQIVFYLFSIILYDNIYHLILKFMPSAYVNKLDKANKEKYLEYSRHRCDRIIEKPTLSGKIIMCYNCSLAECTYDFQETDGTEIIVPSKYIEFDWASFFKKNRNKIYNIYENHNCKCGKIPSNIKFYLHAFLFKSGSGISINFKCDVCFVSNLIYIARGVNKSQKIINFNSVIYITTNYNDNKQNELILTVI